MKEKGSNNKWKWKQKKNRNWRTPKEEHDDNSKELKETKNLALYFCVVRSSANSIFLFCWTIRKIPPLKYLLWHFVVAVSLFAYVCKMWVCLVFLLVMFSMTKNKSFDVLRAFFFTLLRIRYAFYLLFIEHFFFYQHFELLVCVSIVNFSLLISP